MPIQRSDDAPASASTDEPKANFPPEFQAFFEAIAHLVNFEYTAEQWMEIAKTIQHFHAKPDVHEKALWKLLNSARSYFSEKLDSPGRKRESKLRLKHWTKTGALTTALMSELSWLGRVEIEASAAVPCRSQIRRTAQSLL